MAPQPVKLPAPASNGQPSDESKPIGPPSGLAAIPTQYNSEQSLRQMMKSIGYDEAREDGYRLKGIQLIDAVRQSLQLPVRTFDTAAIYYHKFRVRFPSNEYNYEDVAMAALFVACKAEDTIKKSKEILCAMHNLRQPHDQKTPDDKAFESMSRFTVGLERHILETIGFDFRVQYPQKLLVKMVRRMFPREDSSNEEEGRKFLRVAYDMSIDLYKTFAPVKQTTFTLVLAVLELTALLMGTATDRTKCFKATGEWHTERACILETILDLLDLYTQFPKSTKIGHRFDLTKLMDVKINLNNLISKEKYQRYHGWCDRCAPNVDTRSATPASATSPATNPSLPGSGSVKRKRAASEGTQRFVFDADEARKEKEIVGRYFNDEYEELEVEVEEPIREPESRYSSRSNNHSHRSHGTNHADYGWSGNPRNRHGQHNDRHRSRRGHGY